MSLKTKTLFTSQPSTDREKKNLLFLKLIQKHTSISRTEITKLTGINAVTVSNYTNTYLKNGLAFERGYDISSGGRRPELVELNKKQNYTIGISLEGNSIDGVLVDFGMEILAEESIDKYKKDDLKFSINEVVKKLSGISKVDKARIRAIGISISADYESAVESIIRAKEKLEDEIHTPILIGDAATCAAFGEKNLNQKAKDAENILYIHGDVGKGVLIKGDEFYEAKNEIDHFAYLRPWGQALSVVSQARKIAARGVGTKIINIAGGNVKDITVDTVIKAAREKDEVAIDLIKTTGMNLGVRIAYLINAFEPETVIVGGGIEEAGNIFFDPLNLSVQKSVTQKMSNKIRVVAAFLGKEASRKGAASLAIRESFINA